MSINFLIAFLSVLSSRAIAFLVSLFSSVVSCLKKANKFGDRVKENSSRVAMEEFDSFLFFELHPEYSFLLDEIENYSIRLFASIFSNLVNVKGLNVDKIKLVNKQIKK